MEKDFIFAEAGTQIENKVTTMGNRAKQKLHC